MGENEKEKEQFKKDAGDKEPMNPEDMARTRTYRSKKG
jgi:hypothetical protein